MGECQWLGALYQLCASRSRRTL
ncbi:unnamed protein product [Oikopleura dioica]|uniref:Uncharacterized protein n=1 Tax=Oikopleura dioica TaxID=34765 RepID=E4YTS2_OIKDI|nr:unnamed protein product [Oikopleura dioica]